MENFPCASVIATGRLAMATAQLSAGSPFSPSTVPLTVMVAGGLTVIAAVALTVPTAAVRTTLVALVGV